MKLIEKKLKKVVKGVYFVISENATENKKAIELSEKYLCGVGLFDPKIIDIDREYFYGKHTPLVVFTNNSDVKNHIAEFAKIVTEKDMYEKYCIETSNY